jgi:aryl-alcohol dehydrogenase-like predicted oxidoreductase
MKTRKLGPFDVTEIGLGCMSLSHAYGKAPTPEAGSRLLNRALDLGCTFLDTAALYGLGANETLLGEAVSHRRNEFTLASKCGIGPNEAGQREIDGRPERIKATCEGSLKRLKTEVIDLYYLHRWDKRVPIEDSVGALADLVAEGKVRTIGLSEVSAATLRKAHAVHPITALQNEYSLWTRNPEVASLEACRELGTTLVAFSPVGRGFLADGIHDLDGLPETDIRRGMPRFQGENLAANLRLLAAFRTAAKELGGTPAQVCIAWLLAKADHIVPIPGTSRIDHMEENFGGAAITLDAAAFQRLDDLVNSRTVAGNRYNPNSTREIDTEEIAA